MARKKPSTHSVNFKSSLSRRLKEVRQDRFGEHGGPELARRLNLPARSWYNYENGVTVPAEVLLGFIDETGINPVWLLTGEGSMYRKGGDDSILSPVELIRRGLERLEGSPGEAGNASSGGPPADYVAVRIFPWRGSTTAELDSAAGEGEILALRQWVTNPSRTIAARLIDDAMYPVLPVGSIVAIDRSVTDPRRLHGRIVAACPEETPMIRWLDVSGRHLILRPNLPGREFPLVPLEVNRDGPSPILGEIVCSWNRFREA